MQRIQSWFDQLSINRQSRRRARRTHSRQPDDDDEDGVNDCQRRNRNQKFAQATPRAASHSVHRHHQQRDELKPLPVTIKFPPPPPSLPPIIPNHQQQQQQQQHHHMSQIGSFPRRNRIRTNPWIGAGGCGEHQKAWSTSTTSIGRRSMESTCQHHQNLCVASPDTSMCSSGYASNDSSPDTSMVWLQSGEWKNYENQSNIYHELLLAEEESSQKYDGSGSLCSLSQPTPSPKLDGESEARRGDESPIYAEPWTQYPSVERNEKTCATPLVVRNCAYRPASPAIYSQPWTASSPSRRRNPIAASFNEMSDDELARDEFLHELDLQIHELQMRSEELREMVERARQSRKEYLIIPKMECTFELAI